MFGGAVTLAAAAAVILWQAFKHLDLKIKRLEDKIDKKFDEHRNYFDQKLDQKFDQLMAGIAEISRLVAGHDAQIKAHEKQLDRLSEAVFTPPQLGAPSPHQERAHQEEAHAPESATPAEAAAAPGEGVASSAGGPEPTLPPAAIAPA